MANFSGSINLLSMKGAKVFSGLDPQHPKLNFVCIPCAYNDIELSQDGKYANVGVYMQETNEKFRQACIQRRQQSGDPVDGYTPPSHQMEVSFRKDFRERAMEAARKRIVAEHPEWQADPGMQQPDSNKDLKIAIYDALRIRLGSFYAKIRQQQAPVQAVAPAAIGQEWTPPSLDPITGQPIDDSLDDLPF